MKKVVRVSLLFLAVVVSGVLSCAKNSLFAEDLQPSTVEALQKDAERNEALAQPPPVASDALAKVAQNVEVQNVETTLFDLYLGDKYRGSILANYTDHWFEVENPRDILDQLDDVVEGEALLPLMEGRIPKSRQMAALGTFSYDLNTFRIILLPNPRYLKGQGLNLKGQLPDPEAGFSLQQKFSVAASGDLSQSPSDATSAVQHSTIFGAGRAFGKIEGVASSDEKYRMDEASGKAYISNYEISAGLLQSQGMMFSPSLQYAGAKIATSEDMLVGQDLIHGSRFEVFIPSRSRVEFYRDGRLISVQMLDFGLQEIDTSEFPQGSYDVDIVIQENSGRETRERKFYTKSGFLVSRAYPVYSFAAGVQRDEFSMEGTPLYEGSVRWRALDIMELDGSVYGTDELGLGGAGIRGLYRDFRFNLGGVVSTKAESGMRVGASLPIFGISFDTEYTKSFNTDSEDDGIAPTPTPTPVPGRPPEFSPLSHTSQNIQLQNIETLSFSAYKSIGAFDLRYVRDRNKNEDQPERHTSGPSLTWRIYESGGNSLRMVNSWYETERGKTNSYGLFFHYPLVGNLALDSQIGWYEDDDSEQLIVYTALDYEGKTRGNRGTRYALSDELRRERNSDNQGSSDVTHTATNQLSFDSTGDYLQTIGFLRDVRSENTDNTNLGLNAQSSFILSDDGAVSFSYPIREEAVFIADLRSNTTNSNFELLLDGQIYETVTAGKAIAIGMTPFKTYKITLRPTEGADLVSYESKEESITFFPGNVVKRTWNVDRMFILLGRLVDKNGAPIARQRIRGTKEYVATEDDGSFQAEINGAENLRVESRNYKCTIKLTIQDKPDFVLDAGDVLCE